ncbi:MAG: hypothetical protein WCG84_03935, partial [Candidatus Moraniibacteriota bacterium]
MSAEKKTLKVRRSFGSGSSLSTRKFFKKRIMVSLPNLIEVQTESYSWFWEKGLQELFAEINPVSGEFASRDLELSFGDYYLDEPKHDEFTAKEKNISYEAPLRAKAILTIKKTGEVKEQEIY